MLAFRVAVAGLLSECVAETRLELNKFPLEQHANGPSWLQKVSTNVINAFCLLVRKSHGWADIEEALSGIHELRDMQRGFEDTYLNEKGEPAEKALAALELVGLYHLAQIMTVVGEYIKNGRESITQINSRIDRHRDRASSAFKVSSFPGLLHLTDLAWVGCRQLAQNSIWTHVKGLGQQTLEFARYLASPERPNPVIELWPSQQEALHRNLLDPYKRAILVEMPTSAGKTLLAKFTIVQTKALNPAGTVAYIVPTRALVNQITIDLRSDFRQLGYRVEQTIPAFEMDPTEEKLLSNAPDVLVTTPEKLDLLVRRDHPVTQNLSLVIADEAHNIREKDRGPRLELLLGTIKRDRASTRFLLLSPFLPNDSELVKWLGDGRALDPISVHWKPSRKIVGAVKKASRRGSTSLIFETLAAADNREVREGIEIPIARSRNSQKSIEQLSLEAVPALLRRGGAVLILCRGQGTAMTRAIDIARSIPAIRSDTAVEATCHYIDAEMGYSSQLSNCLRHGVTYHHGGLSHEVRWLIEALVRADKVRVVCGTTTLAQGINFPITSVIVETLKKGDAELTYHDFWNVAGRAGRAMVDSLGVVAFPSPGAAKLREYKAFLQNEALEISSQLTGLIDRADVIANRFNLDTIRNTPELSALLQFLAHAMRVSGTSNIADEVEDLLRASLVYHQAQRMGRDSASRLVALCRSYLESISQRRGVLALADKTGFATPSVLNLLMQKSQKPDLSDPENWKPETLFGDDTSHLRSRIEVIAGLPEMQLGQGAGRPFNAERVAQILRAWVKGTSLHDLSQNFLISEETDTERRVGEFSRYLFSQLLGRASWGLGALENVCLTDVDQTTWGEVGYIPSMIFFGVQQKEAIWLRMVGVPRLVSEALGKRWREGIGREPVGYDELRTWVSHLTDLDWEQSIPRGMPLTGRDMKEIWNSVTS
jgi:superfamily II DNA/RNA helicase